MPLDKLFSALGDGKSDPKALLGGLLGSPGSQGAMGGAASGALVSMLMNPKSRKKISKHAVKVGGIAAVAGIGYYAYRKWQQGRGDTPPALPASSVPAALPPPMPQDACIGADEPVPAELPMKMVLAMIAAAAADGSIDPTEMDALAIAIDDAPVTATEKARLSAALNQPPTVEDIAALATHPEEASEIYGAALTAIDIDTPSEHLFLRRLGRAMDLDDGLLSTLHETLENLEPPSTAASTVAR
jgi:uncharacterized membrane protein YebE (DUF533 family)